MAYYPTLWRARRAPVAWNDVFGRFDRLFDADSDSLFSFGWSPVTDVREDDDGVHLSVELPGMTNDDISVEVENGVLSISGEKKQESEQGEAKSDYHLVERRYGRFERRFRLPRGANADKVKAKFEKGVLNIEVPKSEKAKRKLIPIK